MARHRQGIGSPDQTGGFLLRHQRTYPEGRCLLVEAADTYRHPARVARLLLGAGLGELRIVRPRD